MAFRDIEEIVKMLADERAIKRAGRLRERAGVARKSALETILSQIVRSKTKDGFESFKTWLETASQGIVLTAHPTFALPPNVYETLGQIASKPASRARKDVEHLKTLPYRQKRPPSLQEEHAQTQQALTRIQPAIDTLNKQVLAVAKDVFPNRWTALTPCLFKVYSWVGYDIDGRTDIGWTDAIRLRLLEKQTQLNTYLKFGKSLQKKAFTKDGAAAMTAFTQRLKDAVDSTSHDLTLFEKDLTDTDNLVEAANHLTRKSKRRLRNTSSLYALLETALKHAKSDETRMQILILRAKLRCYGLGTARIHFRLNSRHVMNGIRSVFGIKDTSVDSRTLVMRAAKKTKGVKPESVNFASLALEKNTAHRQMILTAQIHKYIDNETPIRLLIAETEDSLIPLGMLYLAKLYSLEDHLDISPLFETATALNNGGRIIGKMLSHGVYRDYVKKRGVFAIQTGFSDAGRFMGQIPATLAIERLQSHLAIEMAKHDLQDVSTIIFNTHGESMGRGGHFGTLADRLDYVMSPWAKAQFDKRGLPFCHETSFQGGDGFLWFQTGALAYASILSLITSRHAPNPDAQQDPFYKQKDFSWDLFRTMSSEQDQLYNNSDYVGLLGTFGQNLLIATGSRAVKRNAADRPLQAFTPGQMRAIPHNAILQQFGVPANVYYGLGRAAQLSPENFTALVETSDRARRVFGLARKALERSNTYILTAYGRLFDPGFWIGRSLSGEEPLLFDSCQLIASTLTHNTARSQMVDFANLLRMDLLNVQDVGGDFANHNRSSVILHALRLAVLMKMNILATQLPQYGEAGTSSLDVLKRLQSHQLPQILERLRAAYPQQAMDTKWTKKLSEKTKNPKPITQGYPHLADTIIKPLARAEDLSKQISIALIHEYDAFG